MPKIPARPLPAILARRKPKESLAATLKQGKKQTDNAPHLIIEARAGTGKTTTLVEGLKVIIGRKNLSFKDDPSITPSIQQAAIWEAMSRPPMPVSVCFVAFSKPIATELQRRVPKDVDAMTMHSMGLKAVIQSFDLGGQNIVNNFRVGDIIAEILGRDIHDIRRKDFELLKATEKLVNLCKMNLIEFGGDAYVDHELSKLASHYDVELNDYASRVFDLVPKVLERCKDVARDGCIDYADMIWLPIVLNLHVQRYDLLLVDEAQDLNRCQQALAMKAGRRLILCGDPKQAIYGFAGADSKSMERMQELLGGNVGSPDADKRGCQVLPLTVTYRCGKTIVKEAQKYVPDIEAHESNSEGFVRTALMKGIRGKLPCNGYREDVADGDMILCRVNAPLISECFKFLGDGRKANIQGRDVGAGLISTIKRICKPLEPAGVSIPTLMQGLSNWLHAETQKEQAKRNPNENRLIALQDRYDCIVCFMEGRETVEGVITKIEGIFTDDKENDGIKLSSVHKAKGLEASRVFLLQPEGAGIPHPMAKSAWQVEQEYNLLYVAITRAIDELVYVS